jgi:hypothetical protein
MHTCASLITHNWWREQMARETEIAFAPVIGIGLVDGEY